MNLLQINIEKFMKLKGFTMKSLSLAAGLNETAIRDILKGRVASPTYRTLEKIAKVFGCSIAALAGNEVIDQTAPVTNKQFAIPSLTGSFNRELFIKTIVNVDKIIEDKRINLPPSVKAEVYLAWYELASSQTSDPSSEKNLALIMPFLSK